MLLDDYEALRKDRVAVAKALGDHYRALSAAVSDDLNDGWNAVRNPEVVQVINIAAYRVATAYENVMEQEDLVQEAWIIMATRLYDRLQECLEGVDGATLGTLQHELEMDLVDLIRPIARRQGQNISLDALLALGVEL